MLRLMTPGRMRVLNTVRQRRSTVSALAKRLTRDVSAVSRDVAAMEKVAC
jgi:predicted transcriptional regulator